MPFGVVSGVGREMGVLDGSRGRRRGRGSFAGECGASHCNQWQGACNSGKLREFVNFGKLREFKIYSEFIRYLLFFRDNLKHTRR